MAKLDEKFIVNLKGKDFVTYEGLLDLAHQKGLTAISTELIQVPSKDNDFLTIVKATAITKDGHKFDGIGDADNKSVGSFIAVHKIRMAETRAKARALRDLTNVGMTAVEEIMEDEPNKNNKMDENHKAIKNNSMASEKQLNLIYKLVKDKNYGTESMANYIGKMYGKKNSTELNSKEASELIETLNGM